MIRNRRFGVVMRLGVSAILLLVLGLSLPQAPAFAQTGGTAVGSPTIVGLTRLITVRAPYTGDTDGNNSCTFQYKKVGDAAWVDTFPMYPDRVNRVWSGMAYALDPGTNYDLKL
ncbi:MAG: hypothetical protein V1724_02975, partial [Chloroflexota bacterium]